MTATYLESLYLNYEKATIVRKKARVDPSQFFYSNHKVGVAEFGNSKEVVCLIEIYIITPMFVYKRPPCDL